MRRPQTGAVLCRTRRLPIEAGATTRRAVEGRHARPSLRIRMDIDPGGLAPAGWASGGVCKCGCNLPPLHDQSFEDYSYVQE